MKCNCCGISDDTVENRHNLEVSHNLCEICYQEISFNLQNDLDEIEYKQEMMYWGIM